MKKIILAIFFIFLINNSSAFAFEEIKPAMPRLGVNGELEVKRTDYVAELASIAPAKQRAITQKILSSTDMANKKISLDLAKELNSEKESMLEDLRVLWVSAVERSETIKFAIMKLSNPDGEKVEESKVKNFLKPIASVSPLLATTMAASPGAAAASFLGGGLLGSLLSDNNAQLKTHMTRVSDADLIILAKEIDDLQQKLVALYYNYITAQKVLDRADELVLLRFKTYNENNENNSPNLLLADTFYREALDNQYKARQDFIMARVNLEQFVGNQALSELEKNLKSRKSQTKN